MKCMFCEFEGDLLELQQHSVDYPGHPIPVRHQEETALDKSTYDHFDYLAILKNGFVFYYEDAAYNGEWVHFSGIIWVQPELSSNGFGSCPIDSTAKRFLDRGLDVLRSEIAAIADAPMGS